MYYTTTEMFMGKREQYNEDKRFEVNLRAQCCNATTIEKISREKISAANDINNSENIIVI